MTNLSSPVIEEDSPHRPTVLGAVRHLSQNAVMHVSLCRQNADASVNVLREPLRFHGLVELFSFRLESSVLPEESPQACPQRQAQDQATSPTRSCEAKRALRQRLYHTSSTPRSSIPEPMSARGNFLYTTLSTEPGTVSKMRTPSNTRRKKHVSRHLKTKNSQRPWAPAWAIRHCPRPPRVGGFNQRRERVTLRTTQGRKENTELAAHAGASTFTAHLPDTESPSHEGANTLHLTFLRAARTPIAAQRADALTKEYSRWNHRRTTAARSQAKEAAPRPPQNSQVRRTGRPKTRR